MTADPAIRRAIDADLFPVSPAGVAMKAHVGHLRLFDPAARSLEASGRREKSLLQATFSSGDEVRLASFDAVGFPMDALFPFDSPAPDTKPSEEA